MEVERGECVLGQTTTRCPGRAPTKAHACREIASQMMQVATLQRLIRGARGENRTRNPCFTNGVRLELGSRSKPE
jgi:hypothetical protein